ncbi:MAG: hypothetical protein R3244_07290 [Thermoanaerobaculia bacterium]|nr:hypothetical protein [Thermoanaerobaculia bacterium]
MTERQAYIDKLSAKLEEWDAELDKLEAKAEGLGADARIELQKRADAWREERRELRERLSELKSSGDSAWQEVKAGLESSFDELKQGLERARARLD